MTDTTEADTIRILIATDNHVGYEERDPIRKDDSWKTFDEILNLARVEDVDMVLLAGDLFHDNKPSRKSMYQVMRSLRKNCVGDRPCPLEFLSDASEVFEGAFTHVNYEDPDINISIPVFSIHGNHDDPSGDGNFCSLDLLQASGLLNYFGRVAEADNIEAKPILLQKGATRLALFGLSNVRDERMFRTFRDHKVKWFRPGVQMGDWFNLLAVHQNHHAHTATSYLPENVLPDWMNLVVWGHEHECLIDPTQNPETGFHVMQPGSSVATSLVPGEAVRKHVAVLSVTGKNFKIDKIPLKSVRPFVTKEIVLSQDSRFKGLDKKKESRSSAADGKNENKQLLTKRLMQVVDEMIEEANQEWETIQTDDEALEEPPLPLIRLKVETTASEGCQFECENPQRFSNRFAGRVANTNDIIYFYRKKKSQRKTTAANPTDLLEGVEDPDMVKVESIVAEFLSAQSLKVLPQGPFGDAVNRFVTKDDKHAMELFVSDHLTGQVQQMLDLESDDEDFGSAMEIYKARVEQQMTSGVQTGPSAVERKRVLRPKPSTWDSDFDGNWEDEPDAWTYEDVGQSMVPTTQSASRQSRTKTPRQTVDEEMEEDVEPPTKTTKRAAASTSRSTKAAPAKKAPAKKAPTRSTRGRKATQQLEEEEEAVEAEEEPDVIMESDEDIAAPPLRNTRTTRQPAKKPAPAPARSSARSRQTTLNFSQPPASQTTRATRGKKPGGAMPFEISDDEISDDEDAFEPAPAPSRSSRRNK